MVRSLMMLVLGFGLGILFITYPANKAKEAVCFNNDKAGVVKAEHMDAILFTVLKNGFQVGEPGSLEDLKIAVATNIVACPKE